MSDLPIIHAGGEPRKLGLLPTPPHIRKRFRLSSDVVDVVPRNKWEPVDWSHLVPRIMDQDGIGSCASEAAAQTIEVCREVSGLDRVKLSPGNLYGRVNGGRDQGSTLGDNLQEIQNRGICTERLVSHLDWQNWNAPGWEAEGQRYRTTEIYLAPGFDAMVSAVLKGFMVVTGIMVGNNFNPGADGWLPDYSSGSGGHSMTHVGVAEKGGKWGLLTANSWGTNWGLGGFCVIPQSYFNTYWEDGYAARVAIDPVGDGDIGDG